MSSMATKPSAALTCSPSRTSLQKRQSGCEANDSLLGDVVRPNLHKLALRALDEPRRVVVAVPSPGPVDQHSLLAPELSGPPSAAGLGGERAEPSAALLLHGGRHAVVVSGTRSRPRRVRKDVHLRDAGLLHRVERPFEGGIVLAREADYHIGREVEAPSPLHSAQVRRYVVAPPHLLEDAVVAGLKRDVQVRRDAGRLAHRRDELVGQVIDFYGGQAQPLDARDGADLADQ